MPSIQELREQKEKLKKEICQIRDAVSANEKAGKVGVEVWGGDAQRARWDAANKEYDETCRAIGSLEEISNVIKRGQELDHDTGSGGRGPSAERRSPLDTGGGSEKRTPNDFTVALRAFAAQPIGNEITDEERAACKRVGINPNAKTLDLSFGESRDHRQFQNSFRTLEPTFAIARNEAIAAERRAMSSFVAGTGGVLVPESFVNDLVINMLAVGGIERLAQVLITQTGETMQWPSFDDTSNEGSLIGENATQDEADEPSVKLHRWSAYDFTSDILKVPENLLTDSPANLESVLTQALGERIGRIGNRKFTSGNGIDQPRGIMLDAGLGKTAASATDITGDEVIDLFHSVDPSIRERTTCAFMAHDNIFAILRKKKNSNGDYIWQQGLTADAPDRILGKPHMYNQHMDSAAAASNKTLLFGDLYSYKIRRVRGFRIVRLNELYAASGQVGFLVILRQDGKLFDAGTDPVKYLQQAAS